MKMVSGKQLFEGYSRIGKSLDALGHIAAGETQCKKCNGTGWHPPSKPSLLLNWLRSFPFRLARKSVPPNGADGSRAASPEVKKSAL